MAKSEKLEYGVAANEVYDFSRAAANLAFRATYNGTEEAAIDPSIAKWTVRLVTATDNYFEDKLVEEIPLKFCNDTDLSGFAPSR